MLQQNENPNRLFCGRVSIDKTVASAIGVGFFLASMLNLTLASLASSDSITETLKSDLDVPNESLDAALSKGKESFNLTCIIGFSVQLALCLMLLLVALRCNRQAPEEDALPTTHPSYGT